MNSLLVNYFLVSINLLEILSTITCSYEILITFIVSEVIYIIEVKEFSLRG